MRRLGWLTPRGPEGQLEPAPLPLKARDEELIITTRPSALPSTGLLSRARTELARTLSR